MSVKDIAYIGIRDVDVAERYLKLSTYSNDVLNICVTSYCLSCRYIIDKYGIIAYTMHDIDRHGIAYVMENVLERVNPG